MSTPVESRSRARRVEREKDRFHPWHRKPLDTRGTHLARNPDSPLLDADLDERNFPVFLEFPVVGEREFMAGSSSAIDLDSTTSRSSSSPVPQNHTSNLTSALQGAAAYGPQMTSAVNIASGNDGNSANGRGVGAGRHDSFGGGGGARPISMKGSNRDRPRRESVAGSMVGAMSWGGVSVGSWIRDE